MRGLSFYRPLNLRGLRGNIGQQGDYMTQGVLKLLRLVYHNPVTKPGDKRSAVKLTLFPHTVYDSEQRRLALAAFGWLQGTNSLEEILVE